MAYQDNFAYRPLYGSTPGMVPQQTQFMPSFQSSLNWTPQGVTPGTGPLAQAPTQSVLPTQPVVPTVAPVSAGTMNWAPQGVTPGTGPVSPVVLNNGIQQPSLNTATYLNTPQSQWTGEMWQNYNKANAPSNAGAYAGMALQGVNMAANLGMGIASLVQSQDAFNKQMGMANKNYAAQVKAYNNSLEDKIRGRYSVRQYNANKQAIDSEIESKKQKE